MNGGSVTSTSAFGESFSTVARFTTSPLPAVTILTFTPSFFSKAGNTSLYRFSRPSAVYRTTASAANAGTGTVLVKAATASAGNMRCTRNREAGKRFFVMVLGPVDNQQVQMKEAEIATNDEKRSDSLSYRVAMRRNCLMRQKNRSTRFREAYRCSSKGRRSRRLARLGMTA